MEIGEEANWYKWRDQNIFYGDVSTGKFTEAMIGKKYKIKGYELYDYRQWCINSKTSSELVSGSWNSGIDILDNDNNKIDKSSGVATFEFQRPLVTLYSETMDLVVDTDYLIYLSYGVFPNATSADKSLVKGAIKPNYNLSPGSVAFKLSPDTKTTTTSNSGATTLGFAAVVAAGCALTSLI